MAGKKKLKKLIQSKKSQERFKEIQDQYFKQLDKMDETSGLTAKEDAAKSMEEYFKSKGHDEVKVKLLGGVSQEAVDYLMSQGLSEQRAKQQLSAVSNNVVMLIQSGKESLVATISMERPSVDVAMDRLSQRGEPAWFGETYVTVPYADEELLNRPFGLGGKKPAKIHDFPTDWKASLTVGECYTGLQKRITQLHESKASDKNDQIVRLALGTAKQMCQIFKEMADENILWTDLKIGNVLLGDDDGLIIRDKKAIRPVEQLLLRGEVKFGAMKQDDKAGCVNYDGQTTPPYSPGSKVESCTRETAKEEWEKEYSYQLALVLYQIATNQNKLSDKPFDFNHPIFTSSEEGKHLKKLIEALGRDDPDKRMHFSAAEKFISQLSLPEVERKEKKSTADVMEAMSPGRPSWHAARPKDAVVTRQRRDAQHFDPKALHKALNRESITSSSSRGSRSSTDSSSDRSTSSDDKKPETPRH